MDKVLVITGPTCTGKTSYLAALMASLSNSNAYPTSKKQNMIKLATDINDIRGSISRYMDIYAENNQVPATAPHDLHAPIFSVILSFFNLILLISITSFISILSLS